MYIESIALKDFRNFKGLELSLSSKFNIFIGQNAQGKTNILESISAIARGKSFRTNEFRDMIRWGSEAAFIRARVRSDVGSDEMAASLSEGGKEFKKNGKRVRPSGPKFVLFEPGETMLIKDAPSARRKYTDLFAVNFSDAHRKLMLHYERALTQRNRLLQDESVPVPDKKRQLKVWNEGLAASGADVIASRSVWLERLNAELPAHYSEIAPHDGIAAFRYQPFCELDCDYGDTIKIAEIMIKKFDEMADQEFARGMTLVGPHRDDMVAEIGGLDVKRYGSQGQHRSFVLALKVAEIELHKKIYGADPILLLDDVVSELDSSRNRFFFEYLSGIKGQVFITSTDAGDVMLKLSPSSDRKFEVSAGNIRG